MAGVKWRNAETTPSSARSQFYAPFFAPFPFHPFQAPRKGTRWLHSSRLVEGRRARVPDNSEPTTPRVRPHGHPHRPSARGKKNAASRGVAPK